MQVNSKTVGDGVIYHGIIHSNTAMCPPTRLIDACIISFWYNMMCVSLFEISTKGNLEEEEEKHKKHMKRLTVMSNYFI